jgi:lysophospholipase L1-like esterase
MKKYYFPIVLLFLVICSEVPAIVSNPIISRGKPVYTSSGAAQYLVDDKFNTASWTVTANSWIAIHVNSGPSKVFVNWNNPVYAWSNVLSTASCPNTNSFPVDYNLLTSSNSTNGIDGQWTIADSIRGNIVTARGHLINFSGAGWVKMQIIKGGGLIDEMEVFDASNGDNDVWFFPGTSITANTYKGTPPAQNFADLITLGASGYNPAMIRGGIGCITSSDFVKNLPKYLRMAGNAHFWAIEMGTNDAWGGTNGNVTLFKKNMQLVIDSCKAYGIQPIIARMIATNSTLAGWQVHQAFLNAIDDLTSQNNLLIGPDLYTYFVAHPTELNSDGIHPNATGAASIQRLWAQKMMPLYTAATGIEQVNSTPDDIRIYPNPTKDSRFTISLKNSAPESQVQIYNLQGKLVYSSSLTKTESVINSGLFDGIYVLKTINGQNLSVQNLIIK